MNKYKVLGVALVVAIIVGVGSAHVLGFTSIQFATTSIGNAVFYIAGLSVILFGCF